MLNQPDIQDILSLLGRIYSVQQSRALLGNLMRGLDWQSGFEAYGRRFDIPRRQAWYADAGVHYRYAENQLQSHRWIEPLCSIKQQVESVTGAKFNSVLVTCYRDGLDHVGWHADDERELGDAPLIASLSLGASRKFHYRHKQAATSGSLALHDGELLLMQPDFQRDWQHCVPPQAEIDKPRLNLTFRNVVLLRDAG